MRPKMLFGLVLLLAACGPKAAQNQDSANEKSATASSNGNAPAAEAAGNEDNPAAAAAENRGGVLPAAGAAVRYLGTWATSRANCASKPWRFTRDALNATDGPRCSFYNVAKVPGGYDVAAQCPTKQPIHTDLIKLRFAESAGAMLLESNAIAPTGLIYCGK